MRAFNIEETRKSKKATKISKNFTVKDKTFSQNNRIILRVKCQNSYLQTGLQTSPIPNKNINC